MLILAFVGVVLFGIVMIAVVTIASRHPKMERTEFELPKREHTLYVLGDSAASVGDGANRYQGIVDLDDPMGRS